LGVASADSWKAFGSTASMDALQGEERCMNATERSD
jgi:hypothetical protein